jgi:hypothetical protein
MTRVGLPDWLGGGEGEAPDTDGEVVRVTKYGPDEEMAVVVIQREHLTGLAPELPEEPPNGSVVGIGEPCGASLWQRDVDEYEERDERGEWQGLHDKCWYSWVDICALGTPVRLVPDPAANVELPWRVPANEVSVGAEVIVDVNDDGEVVERVRLVMGGYHQTLFTPAGARAKAGALAAAADAAEKETP